ncbi:MAG: hypothetical protein DMG61_19325 [Acidobacteria bacterium]|nr:MAG: hypothetical protein DMG61_19325 [Acidobacteriota bacterium]
MQLHFTLGMLLASYEQNLLPETYLKLSQFQEAQNAIAKLDELSVDDYGTQAGIGVLLARHYLHDNAIKHFQQHYVRIRTPMM